MPNADGTKANLFATIGPEAEGGIVLSGHTDVVPVDGQPWDTDPWTLTEKPDGNLYGRGTCDMKGFYRRRAQPRAGSSRRRRSRCRCTSPSATTRRSAASARTRWPSGWSASVPRPRAVIVGEPTMMGVVNAQKPAAASYATFTGFEAHSSMTHLGVSAIHFAGDFIHWLNELQVELASASARRPSTTMPATPTINVGIIIGGTAGNILARECRLYWGYRTLPGDDPLGSAAPRRGLHRRAAAAEDEGQASRRQHRH